MAAGEVDGGAWVVTGDGERSWVHREEGTEWREASRIDARVTAATVVDGSLVAFSAGEAGATIWSAKGATWEPAPLDLPLPDGLPPTLPIEVTGAAWDGEGTMIVGRHHHVPPLPQHLLDLLPEHLAEQVRLGRLSYLLLPGRLDITAAPYLVVHSVTPAEAGMERFLGGTDPPLAQVPPSWSSLGWWHSRDLDRWQRVADALELGDQAVEALPEGGFVLSGLGGGIATWWEGGAVRELEGIAPWPSVLSSSPWGTMAAGAIEGSVAFTRDGGVWDTTLRPPPSWRGLWVRQLAGGGAGLAAVLSSPGNGLAYRDVEPLEAGTVVRIRSSTVVHTPDGEQHAAARLHAEYDPERDLVVIRAEGEVVARVPLSRLLATASQPPVPAFVALSHTASPGERWTGPDPLSALTGREGRGTVVVDDSHLHLVLEPVGSRGPMTVWTAEAPG